MHTGTSCGCIEGGQMPPQEIFCPPPQESLGGAIFIKKIEFSLDNIVKN